MFRILLPLSAALLLGSCAGGDSATNRTVWVEDGPPVNCINLNQVRSFRVVDDRTIDFERNRNQAWRNHLPMRCSGLSFGQKIRHNSRTSRLCNFDTITPVSMGGGPNAANCQLGQFQPIKRVPVPETKPSEAASG
jgi:hypothetical protein